MTITGIKKIGFCLPEDGVDTWHETPAERNTDLVTPVQNFQYFTSFDQKGASLNEQESDNDEGILYEQKLSFTLRTQSDMQLAESNSPRPLIFNVRTVDGNSYMIGTAEYPARMVLAKRYDGVNVTELSVSVEYSTLAPIL